MKAKPTKQPHTLPPLVDPLNRFVKAGEMATYLPFSESKLYDMTKLEPSAIPCHRYQDPISGRIYVAFHIQEVLDWFRQFRVGPPRGHR